MAYMLLKFLAQPGITSTAAAGRAFEQVCRTLVASIARGDDGGIASFMQRLERAACGGQCSAWQDISDLPAEHSAPGGQAV